MVEKTSCKKEPGMNGHLFASQAYAVLCLVLIGVTPARGDDSPQAPASEVTITPQQARGAIERGLGFLERDAAKWRKERECATCHHGTLTVLAFSEAKFQGHAVKPEIEAETVKWTKERLDRIDQPRDTRPGWSMVNSPALYLAFLAQAIPQQDAMSADELRRIAAHLVRHQEADGSWAWSSAPAKNRPPPFFESDEVATRLACIALGNVARADSPESDAVRESLKKADAWLKNTTPTDTTQAAALRLLMKSKASGAAEELQAEIAEFMKRRNKDGGWGQLPDRASDAYATGQALYVLNLVGVDKQRAEVQRAVAFLIGNQAEDGSWPMTRRGHPGVTPSNNTVPIVYFGSAWGTLALLRCAPK
jgi:hypothetical protein